MNVVLTHGYFLYEDEKEQQIMKPYPPLGILYISAFLNKYNIANELFDSTFSTPEKQIKFLEEKQPKFVAFYCNLMTKVTVLSQIEKIKSNPKLADTKILFGGPDVTYNTFNYLKYGADVLVVGEGEETMKELVSASDWEDDSLNKIDGIVFINSEKEEIKTKTRTKKKEIDSFPIPNREGIDLSKYLAVWKQYHGESALNVSTQRGCPYTCKWCSTAVYGQSYRRRSPKLVVEELAYLQEQFAPDTFWFVDDVFTVSHKWLDEFVDELESKKLQIKFECITRADRLNEAVLAQLKKAGCFRVWIGAESGSQKIIDKMDRRVSVDQVREMIIEAKRVGIEAGTFIMLGYPGETREDIEETIHHLKVCNPDQFTITLAYPIKGTALHDEVEKDITYQPEWNVSTDREIEFERTYSKEYYRHAVRYVTAEVDYYKLKMNGENWKVRGVKLALKSMISQLNMWIS